MDKFFFVLIEWFWELEVFFERELRIELQNLESLNMNRWTVYSIYLTCYIQFFWITPTTVHIYEYGVDFHPITVLNLCYTRKGQNRCNLMCKVLRRKVPEDTVMEEKDWEWWKRVQIVQGIEKDLRNQLFTAHNTI